jgi:hypothetical protein
MKTLSEQIHQLLIENKMLSPHPLHCPRGFYVDDTADRLCPCPDEDNLCNPTVHDAKWQNELTNEELIIVRKIILYFLQNEL